MHPDDIVPIALNRTLPDNEAVFLGTRHRALSRRWLRPIFNMEAERGVDEVKIIIALGSEDGDLGDGLLTQFGFVLHQEVCERRAVWRT
jgi:hypothetical protein